MKDIIEKRLFIVGCSRSGTTVLQVSVATHPRVASFPETGFFRKILGGRRRLLAQLGLRTFREKEAFGKLLREIDRPDLKSEIPKRPWRFRTSAQAFVHILDTVAQEAGNDLWLEKTPMHIRYIDLMRRYVPRAHFIHTMRDGRDVVASICDRAKKRPERFDEKQKDPSFGVERWNRSLAASRRCLGEAGHSFVVYEQFVEEPGRVMRRLCREIGLAYDARMAEGTGPTAEAIVPEERDWIGGAKKPPEPQPSKFDKLFDRETRERITEKLDLGTYEQIKSVLREGQGGIATR
jgi:hypothetical protein